MYDETFHGDHEWSHADESAHYGAETTDVTFDQSGQAEYGPGPGADTIGHPNQDASDWQWQGTQNGMCGPTSIAMVVNQLGLGPHGQPVGANDVAQWAIAHGDMTADGHANSSTDLGYEMNAEQISAVLDHYGVHNEAVGGGNLQSLESYLNSGHAVILGVDGDRIWHDLPAGQDAGQANHALVVTGIDEKTGWAYVNDPGTSDGREEAVPLSTLMSAWSTSNYTAIVADPAAGTETNVAPHTDNPPATQTHGQGTEGSSGYVILPAMLHQEELVLHEDLIKAEQAIENDPQLQHLATDEQSAIQGLETNPAIETLEHDAQSAVASIESELQNPGTQTQGPTGS